MAPICNTPSGLAVDAAGNVYFADTLNGRVRKILANGTISTVAGCGAANASCVPGVLGDGGPATVPLIVPVDVVVDSTGNVYFSDGQRVRKVSPAGILSTVAGGGTDALVQGVPAMRARLGIVDGLALDARGNLYLTESQRHLVRKVDAAGIITTIAGDGTAGFQGDGGPATAARFNQPYGIAADSAGNVYIADANNARVRRINPAGIITTIAGNGVRIPSVNNVPATSTSIIGPQGVDLDAAGNLYITEGGTARIRKVDVAGIITTLAGDGPNLGDGGPATSARFTSPRKAVVDASGNLYIADLGAHRIRKITYGPPAAAPPSIAANGVVNGASFQPGIVPNSWATIRGSGFSNGTATWDGAIVNGKLPTTLSGVTVTIGGQAAYPYFVSPGQVNLIVPDIGAGPQPVVVTAPNGTSSAFTVAASQYGPAFFVWPSNQVVATRTDYSLAVSNGTFPGATTVAAKPGEVLILWGTGFGPTTPAATPGFQVPVDGTYSTTNPVSVTINDVPATVYGAALASGFAGLYQIAIEVPESLADGAWPVRASIGGVSSPMGFVLSVKR